MKATVVKTLVVGTLVVALAGCAGTEPPSMQSSTVKQGAAGAGLGAIAGAMAGNNIKGLNTGEGAIAGAVLGALIGSAMGQQQDTFSSQLRGVQEQASTVVVNVHNSNGSMTPVVLRRVGNQYLGPRGEYYSNMPTEEMLKAPYGF